MIGKLDVLHQRRVNLGSGFVLLARSSIGRGRTKGVDGIEKGET